MAPKKKNKLVKKAGKKNVAQAAPQSAAAKKEVGGNLLKLREILDISYAERFKKEVMELFEKSAEKGVVLDASLVNRITTPCMQVLLSLSKSASMAKINFKITSPSEAFTRAFNDVGLSKELITWSN